MQAIQQEPVAIIGIGCRFPGADNPREFWKLLRTGRSAIRQVPADRWDSQRLCDEDSTQPGKIASRWGGFLDQVDQFDPRAFPLLPGEALSLDPQQRLLLEVAWEAFEDAGLLFSEVAGSNTSVSIGVGWGDYLRLLTRNWSRIDRYALTGNATSVVANRLSYTSI
jgi:acyl transferase domain-containing protein